MWGCQLSKLVRSLARNHFEGNHELDVVYYTSHRVVDGTSHGKQLTSVHITFLEN